MGRWGRRPVSRSRRMRSTPIVRVSHSMGLWCASHHINHRSHLALDGVCCATSTLHPSFASRVRSGVLPPTVVRVSRSMGVCSASQNLHLSFASPDQWGCAGSTTTSTRRWGLAFDGSALCRPSPPLVLRLWRLMSLCRASHHLHLSFASGVRWTCAMPAPTSTRPSLWRSIGLCRASAHLHPSFASGIRYVCTMLPTPLVVRVMRSMDLCLVLATTSRSRSHSMRFCLA